MNRGFYGRYVPVYVGWDGPALWNEQSLARIYIHAGFPFREKMTNVSNTDRTAISQFMVHIFILLHTVAHHHGMEDLLP
jgi:hypothetical protein